MQKTHRRYLSYLKYFGPGAVIACSHAETVYILDKKDISKRIYAPFLSGEYLYAEFPRDER